MRIAEHCRTGIDITIATACIMKDGYKTSCGFGLKKMHIDETKLFKKKNI
jgi:hypothetical protein